MQESKVLNVAISAAKAGGAICLKYFKDLEFANVRTKSTSSSYDGEVTQADLESETAIVEEIRNAFPDHHFLAEELHSDSIENEHLWVIDPLDGTNNFAHGIPHFAISVAYYRNGIPMVGVILDPVRGDLFTAIQGQGAFWNGTKVEVNQHASLSESMVAVGFYYDRGPMMRSTLDAIDDFFQQQIHGIRRFGTAALDLVQVGLGRFSVFFEYELSPWDFAAARLFVDEAGGLVTTCHGETLPLKKSSILASNEHLHQVALEIVKKHSPNTDDLAN